jgi:hypothetical protein
MKVNKLSICFLVLGASVVSSCKASRKISDDSNLQSNNGSGATEFVYYKGNGENLHFLGFDITDGGGVKFCSEGACKNFSYNATKDVVNIFDENAAYCSTLKIVEEAGKPRRLENKVNSKCVGRTGIFTFRASAKEKEYLYKKGNGENLHFLGDISGRGTVKFCSEGSCKNFTYKATILQLFIHDERDETCATLFIFERNGSKKLVNEVDNNCVGRAGDFILSPTSGDFE